VNIIFKNHYVLYVKCLYEEQVILFKILLIFNIFMLLLFKLSLFFQKDGILLRVSCVSYYHTSFHFAHCENRVAKMFGGP